jgi:biopolymer transport protein ExbD
MKFPRNARIFRGSLDAAPFASLFFVLVIFLLLGSLVYTPGVKVPGIRLPVAKGLPGTEGRAVAVALDSSGQLYFQNQRITEQDFSNRLQQIARKSSQPLTLVVYADKSATYETLLHLRLLALDAGVPDVSVAAFAPASNESRRAP